MSPPDNDGLRRISVDLPNDLIERFDELKNQWGLRRRGAVLERLLETLFEEENEENNSIDTTINVDIKDDINRKSKVEQKEFLDDSSIILINSDNVEKIDANIDEDNSDINTLKKSNQKDTSHHHAKGIDLPGFVRKRTEKLKTSLGKKQKVYRDYDSIIHSVKQSDVNQCVHEALSHWMKLYGNKPKEEVVEACMIWLAREIWPYIDDTEQLPFTWFAANNLMMKFCPSWEKKEPSFEQIMVIAGVLEDPFATKTLRERIPTLIRRFVNSFKRRHNVTSFQTLESTMTVHGALKLLDLPITAGKSISLSAIRESYKKQALCNHPDSGGSTDAMRKINEAYQLLKDLYKMKNT